MSHIDQLEKRFSGRGLFATKEQRKTVEIFALQGYKTFGGTEDYAVLMSYKHSIGDTTRIIIYENGMWDKVNFEKESL